MTPTPEQVAILSAVSTTDTNLMIVARAGCGKTATLEMIAKADGGPQLLLCFNKAIAEEAKRKLPTTTQSSTFNSLGHRIWAAQCGKKLALDSKKIMEIFRSEVDDATKNERNDYWKVFESVTQAAGMARALGYIPADHPKAEKSLCTATELYNALDEPPSNLAKGLIESILLTSIRWAYDGIIDFADQTYMPALFGGSYPKFPLVLVDEYQDLSPINHAMVAKLCRTSRQIGVGDDAQAIYGFRGACDDSMSRAMDQFGMETFPLTTSFRCPSAIVENVRWRVPEFTASRTGGAVDTSTGVVEDNGVVLCRNNAPLLKLAMDTIRSGRSVDVSGVDLSARLVRTMGKLGDESLSQAATLSAIDSWESDHSESKTSADTADAMRVFARQGKTLAQAIGYAKHLFEQSGTVRFMTGHKAKGLEFDHVYHLDQHLCRDSGQDPNLRYVIDTRSKDRLTYINGA